MSGSRLVTPTWDTPPSPQLGIVRGSATIPGVAALNTPAGHAALISGDIGRIITVVRKGLQLDQADVARLANAAQSSISRAESGTRNDPALLNTICTALGILGPARTEQDPAYSEDMRRRDLLKNLAAATSAAMLPAVVIDAAHAARIGSSDIDECWAALRRLQNLEDRQGGGTVYQLTAGIASHLHEAGTGAGSRASAEVRRRRTDVRTPTARALSVSGPQPTSP